MARGWTRASSLWTVSPLSPPGSRLTRATSTGPTSRQARSGAANLDGTGVDQEFIITGAGVAQLTGVAVDAAHIYWTTPYAIGRANLDGTGVDQGFIPAPADGPMFPPGGVSEARVRRSTLPISTGATRTGADHRARQPGRHGDRGLVHRVPARGRCDDSPGVAVDSHHVYWANLGVSSGDGAIGRASIDGTAVERNFVTGVGTPVAVAVNDANIYWANGETATHAGSIGRANLDGTGVNQNFISDPTVTLASAVAVDSSNDFSFGQVKKDKRTGTATLTVKIAEGPGKLRLAKSKKVKADDEGIAGPSATKNKLAIKPKGKARKRLNKKGKATVKARVTYSRSASPKTVVKTITLVKG